MVINIAIQYITILNSYWYNHTLSVMMIHMYMYTMVIKNGMTAIEMTVLLEYFNKGEILSGTSATNTTVGLTG